MEHASTPSHSHHDLQRASEAADGFVNAAPGCWKLSAGRAFTVRAGRAGVLRIAHGRVWATFDLAAGDSRVRAGDHFLSRGDGIEVQAGQSLVLEPYVIGHASPAYFSWEPQAGRALAFLPAPAGWRTEVLQPLADLRAAGGLAAGALARLSSGVVRSTAATLAAMATPLAAGFLARRSADHAGADTGSTEVRDFYYAERARSALQCSNADRFPLQAKAPRTASGARFAV